MTPAGAKTCTKCGQHKPLTEFYAHPTATDGRRPDCAACTRARVNARRTPLQARARDAQQMRERRHRAEQHRRAAARAATLARQAAAQAQHQEPPTMTTLARLHAAAAEHADAGHPVPCQQGTPADRAAWTSDRPEVLARAAEQCAPCPLRTMCRAVAVHQQEEAGAWGGTTPGRRGGTGRITAHAVTQALAALGPATAAQVAAHIVGKPSPRDRQDTAGALARLAATGRATARRVRGNVNEYHLTTTEGDQAA